MAAFCGPAWPTVVAGHSTEKDFDMKPTITLPLPISELTLRDYFASAALPWCMENMSAIKTWREEAASDAYQMADVMLVERAKP